jgi:hypothetical protein
MNFWSRYNSPNCVNAISCARNALSLVPALFERMALYILSVVAMSPLFFASAASSRRVCVSILRCSKAITRLAADVRLSRVELS